MNVEKIVVDRLSAQEAENKRLREALGHIKAIGRDDVGNEQARNAMLSTAIKALSPPLTEREIAERKVRGAIALAATAPFHGRDYEEAVRRLAREALDARAADGKETT